MNVLVTGTDGYIGVVLAPLLKARGHAVTGLDTGFYCDGWLGQQPATSMTRLCKDTRHMTPADLQGFDAVVHLAELSNDPLGQHNPALTHQINHHASVELARMCKNAGVGRFVYSSSCSVYGVGSDDFKTEESAPNPQTAYAVCKVLAERDMLALAGEGFAPVMLRNATAYGPSPRMRFDIVLNNLAGLAWTTHAIRMTSDGTPWRPLVHVADIGLAMACAVEAPAASIAGQIFNVGDTAQNYRVREIAQIVGEAFPGCEVSVGTSSGDNRSYRVSFEKINSSLPGFRCQHAAQEGAQQLRELFERVALTREMFDFRAYTRLHQLEYLLQTHQINDQFFWEGAA